MFDHDQVRPAYAGESKRAQVEAMFDRIAPRYDALNRVMSLGTDRAWRRRLIRAVMAERPRRALDVATGTGDLALALARAGVPEVVGVDISHAMLAIARGKRAPKAAQLRFERADAEALPFDDGAFDAVTVAFGVRNFEHLERGLRELLRVLRPGGLLAILELSTPSSPLLRALHALYTGVVVPRLGKAIAGERAAYEYLPASVHAFPAPAGFATVLERCDARDVRWEPLTFGAAAFTLARR